MKVYFNSIGVITSTDFTGDSLRQGAVGIVLKAFFEGVTNTNYTATLNFTRSDGSNVSGLIMELDATNLTCYKYKFADPWFFAKAGVTTLSIYLRDANNNVIAQGQVQFTIEKTDYDAEPTITVSQYNALVSAIQLIAQAIGNEELSSDIETLVGSGYTSLVDRVGQLETNVANLDERVSALEPEEETVE